MYRYCFDFYAEIWYYCKSYTLKENMNYEIRYRRSA